MIATYYDVESRSICIYHHFSLSPFSVLVSRRRQIIAFFALPNEKSHSAFFLWELRSPSTDAVLDALASSCVCVCALHSALQSIDSEQWRIMRGACALHSAVRKISLLPRSGGRSSREECSVASATERWPCVRNSNKMSHAFEQLSGCGAPIRAVRRRERRWRVKHGSRRAFAVRIVACVGRSVSRAEQFAENGCQECRPPSVKITTLFRRKLHLKL